MIAQKAVIYGKTNKIAILSRHAGAPVDFVREILSEDESRFIFKDKIYSGYKKVFGGKEKTKLV